jgi:hypothetical protein
LEFLTPRASGRLGNLSDMTGRVWVDSDLLFEQNDSALFFGDKLCSAMFRSSTTRGVDEYSHVFASVTGISRFAVVE